MSNSKYNYTDKHTLYHIFSKTPVRDNQGLEEVVNKSGHTVLAKQLFVDEIPWFPKFKFNNVFSNKITQNARREVDYVVIEDKSITVIDETTGQEFTTNVYQRNNTEYPESGKIIVDGKQIDITDIRMVLLNSAAFISEFWTPINFHDGYQVKNAEGQRVLVYHKDIPLTYLTSNNNSSQDSNKTAARAFNEDGEAYELFVSGMEAIYNSIPSSGLNPVVHANISDTNPKREALTETLYTDNPSGYFANNFNGTIFFNADYSSLSPTISFFQYVGTTLDKKIDSVDTSIESLEKRVEKLEEGGGTGGDTDVSEIVAEAITDATLSDEGGIADVEEDSENADKLVTASQVKTYVTGAISEIEIPEIPEQITYEGSGEDTEDTEDDIIVSVTEHETDTTKKIISAKFSKKTNSLLTTFAKASDLTALQTTVGKAAEGENPATGLIGDIAALQTTVGSIEGNVTDIQGNITDIQTTIGAEAEGENPATGIIGDIAALQEAVGTPATQGAEATGLHKEVVTLKTNFANYYNKSEVYTKSEIDGKILTDDEDITAESTNTKLVRAKDVTGYVDGKILTDGEDITATSEKLVRAKDVVEYVTDITSGDITISVGTTDADGNVTSQNSTGIVVAGSSPEDGDIEVTVTKDGVEDGVANLTIGAKLKTSFATTAALNELSDKVDGISALSFKKLDKLPETPAAEHLGTIYLIPKTDGTEKDTHDEYICIESEVEGVKKYSWELIGNTDIDLAEITLKSINGITGDDNNKNLTIEFNQMYHGSSMIENDATNKKIVFNPAQGWEYDGDSFANVVKVENGVCYDTNNNVLAIIDDGNLTKGQHTIEGQFMPQGMFMGAQSLQTFIGDLSNLTDGSYMFMYSTSLKTFIGDLGKMTNGTNMFMYCGSLETMNTDLSSLENGTGMFSGCTNLTPESVDIIIDMLPTYTSGTHKITIPTASDAQIKVGSSKGWTIATA